MAGADFQYCEESGYKFGKRENGRIWCPRTELNPNFKEKEAFFDVRELSSPNDRS